MSRLFVRAVGLGAWIQRRPLIVLALAGGAACGDNDFGEGPHTAMPSVISAGGPVLAAPRWAAITFPDDPLASDLDQFLTTLATSNYWKTAVSEYGVGAATAIPVHVSDRPPVSTDDAGIQAYLEAHLSPLASGWPAPDANTVYALYYPQGTMVTGCGVSFAAYHSDFLAMGGKRVAYAVIPRCANYGADPLEELTEFSTHEFAEAATDPYFFETPAYQTASDYAWQERANGGEVGDMCQYNPGSNLVDPELGHLVQRIWSNEEAAAGHDPCVPHPDGDVYFQAAPAATDTVTLSFSSGADVTTSGLQIPLHSTRTIDVDLFSDEPTAPIAVSALQWPSDPAVEQPADLAISWDRTSGINGETLHLTVTVNADQYWEGHEYLIVTSQVGDLQQQWPVVIAN